ncbi:2-hydroxyglutaryl-CoA dehydratase [Haliangium ochraceum]|uniref:Putative activator of 2-hydroxyglutaryl-CoA dehydratase n=1 Tax=Haliangium ochraceum (strain DSM 14365 / JCM 11303 / SMP-2) TaxID=502025 RepID=D0LLV3_HALO1|nr:2-hydroxyglutaryl-CoA dehydratase [Haliangium ochraceum]ACY15131.1 putative activator of 2-hydroxyglutaryl-CoA dehydratase [Haliangium ochraceum DSM 14365]
MKHSSQDPAAAGAESALTMDGAFELADLDAETRALLEAELAQFETLERERLGLASDDDAHWTDPVPSRFTAEQRAHTTLWVSGLTMAHDLFIQSALRGIGYKVKAMDVPDTDALQFGREFGNRGQCNPTYFTVGNLVKHLTQLRDQGIAVDDIIENHVFVTAGACGPCRFGTYVTEYRKALRDAGFEGFRVLLFQQTGGVKQATGDELGLKLDPAFFWAVFHATIIGDVLNALGYRIRPYEVEAGATDRALERCKHLISEAMERGTVQTMKALYQARKELEAVAVDRTQVRPRVAIIGEFWAMTTEGDGNYGLQRFLESEGAEVDIQLVSAWLLYMVWTSRWDTEKRASLRGTDQGGAEGSKFSLEGVDVGKRVLALRTVETLIAGLFQSVAKVMGLRDYHLPDMDELADISHAFYDNSLRGGEGHMEVGKLIQNIVKNKVNMTLSVKPFGCMPSSSVSDGVQSIITEMYPQGIFLPIETNGDGAVNVYSRVQMQLFKAKQAAQREVEQALAETGQTMEQVRAYLKENPALSSPFHRSPHRGGCVSADLVYEVADHAQNAQRWQRVKRGLLGFVTRRKARRDAGRAAVVAARAAAAKVRARRSSGVASEAEREAAVEAGHKAPPAGRKSLKVIA